MDKEEPNVNISGEIPDSELVLEPAKVEQKYENNKNNAASCSDFSTNFAGN